MSVPAWLKKLSQQSTRTPVARIQEAGNVDQKSALDKARLQLMTGGPNDPATWAAYKLVYGKPHGQSPEGKAAASDPAMDVLANDVPYTDFRKDSGDNYYPGRAEVDKAAGYEGANMQDIIDNPAANQALGFGAQTIKQDAIGQSFNDNQFADADTAQWLAKQLGGEYIPAEDYVGGPAGWMPGAASIKMPDGQILNAGLVGQKFKRIQDEYRRQAMNYERNLAQNSNIVGTGFLSKPGDPIQMLKNRLAGTPYANTNVAGGNDAIYRALAQGQNAFGKPLGGGLENRYPNVSPPADTGGGPPPDAHDTDIGDTGTVPDDTDTLPGDDTGTVPDDTKRLEEQIRQHRTNSVSNDYNGPPPNSVVRTRNPFTGGGGWRDFSTGNGSGFGSNYNPFAYQNVLSGYNPQAFGAGGGIPTSQVSNPWAVLGQQGGGGGMNDLGQLLAGIQALRGGRGGSAFGNRYPGMMGSFVPQRRPQISGGSLNSNYYGLS